MRSNYRQRERAAFRQSLVLGAFAILFGAPTIAAIVYVLVA